MKPPHDTDLNNVVYLFGLPKNSNWTDLFEAIEIKTKNKDFTKTDRFDHKDESGHDCSYIQIIFKSTDEADLILQSKFELFGHPILVIPQVEKVDLS